MKKTISDETLFAYVDEELDAAGRAEVEAAMAADPALAQRVQQQRSLRTLLGAAYRPVLETPPPAPPSPPKPTKARVFQLASARQRKPAPERGSAPGGWRGVHLAAMAGCLALGALAGYGAWVANATDDFAQHDGRVVATGALAHALSIQASHGQAVGAPVRLGPSFVSRGDEFCRSFTRSHGSAAGLACRRGNEWDLRVLVQEPSQPALSAAVQKAIDEQIGPAGALDAEAERAAMNRGWRH